MIRVCIQCEISKGSGISCANIKAGRRDLTTLIAKLVCHITTVMLYATMRNSYKLWKSITNVFHVEGDNYRFRSPDKAFASRFFSWFLHLRSLAWNSLAASVDDMLLPNCWAQTSAHFCHDEHLMREIRNTIQNTNTNLHIFINNK